MNESYESEIHYGDCPCRPEQIGIIIQGKQGKLLSNLYTAAGEGLHPTVLLFHGIPGCEQNLDIAQELRRSGFHVMTFHYSGSWGSEGNYSIQNDLDDANTVLDFILNNETYNFDKNKIYAVGHSLGGFVCCQIAADRSEIKAAALLMPCNVGRIQKIEKSNPKVGEAIISVLNESANWLAGVKKDQLYNEAVMHSDEFSMENKAEHLVDKPILCITGTLDEYTPKLENVQPLLTSLSKLGNKKIVDLSYDTDHSFSDYRLTISHDVVSFLKSIQEK